jgi:transposase
MEETVGLSVKERAHLVELELVKRGRQTLRSAAERAQLSERQMSRIQERYRRLGAKGLAHASRGRPSNRSLEGETKDRALEICRGRLEGFGPTLAAEKLLEDGLRVDHETLRRWLIAEGLWSKKKRRGPHRKWRPAKEHFGELVQMDGSFHDWLETGEKPCLIDMVDDATSRMSGRFFEQETTAGAMRVLWGWIDRYGIPRALYTDHKNVYVTEREPSMDEQLAGQPPLTAFGKACHKLGIEIIAASSPQAKGRIERRHGVLQDRLVKELRLGGIKDLESANELLAGGFIDSINRRFAHSAASDVDYHRHVPDGLALEDVFVFEEGRTVQNDWTVVWEGCWYQITGPAQNLPRRRERILARRRLDGTRELLRAGRRLNFHALPERPRHAPPIERAPAPRHLPTPAADHPWNGPYSRSQIEKHRLIKTATRAPSSQHRVDP